MNPFNIEPKILFLEDDELLAESIMEQLSRNNYNVTWAQEGEEAIDYTYDNSFHLFLFDVNVPGINGFDLLKSLRESGDVTPCIFLTSRNQLIDMKKGFDSGGDDYIRKPFDLQELLIRIESKIPRGTVIHITSDFSLDPSNRCVVCKDESMVLPSKEFVLLHHLQEKRGQVVEIEELIGILSYDKEISVNTLRTYVKTLKRKIDSCATINNLRGLGYRLEIL